MHCPHCKAEVDPLPFCPYCGNRLDEANSPPSPPVATALRNPRSLWIWILGAIVVLASTALIVAGVGLAGYYRGLQERERIAKEQAQEHYQRGLEYMQEENYALAAAEFEMALQLNPDLHEAMEQWSIAQEHLKTQPTPTTEVRAPDAPALFAQAEKAYKEARWAEAVQLLQTLRENAPSYHTAEVEQMLFQAAYNQGRALVEENRLEEALTYFEQALAIRPDATDVQAQRRMAALYLNATSYWEADWERVVNSLSQLYDMDPTYKDVEQRLYQASVAYGDQLVENQMWCAAAKLYGQALSIHSDDEIARRKNDAQWLCQTTTPTPVVDEDGTLSETNHSAFTYGAFYLSRYDSGRRTYDLYLVRAKDLVWHRLQPQATQPALSPTGEHLAFHSVDPEKPGLYALNLLTGDLITITTSSTARHPTWSPTGGQIAFNQYDSTTDTWYIIVASIDNPSDQETVAEGWDPAWGPENWLAFTTCRSESECGIHVMNMRSRGLLQLTNSKHDRAISWSPDGTQLAYMSDVGRSPNIYVVTMPSGQVRQLTRDLFVDGAPTWSPDGQHIAFLSQRSGRWGVYTMDPQGNNQALAVDVSEEFPDWDTARIVWWGAPELSTEGHPTTPTPTSTPIPTSTITPAPTP